jgi:class 3 adenylate cyclase
LKARNVHTLRQGDQDERQEATDTRILQFPAPHDRANRTFMCTVLFLDIVEYAKKSVSEQLKAKELFNVRFSEAIRDVAVNDRIVLDTGDGAAVNFLGDPEDALFVAMRLAQAFSRTPSDSAPLQLRIGVNLGPVRLVRDINSQPNIIGDGVNVAQRVMSFARPGQVLVSRSYYDTVTQISSEYARLFSYQGSRTDKHVREHEIYEVAAKVDEALELATRRHQARPTGRPALADLTDPGAATSTPAAAPRVGRLIPYIAAAASSLALLAAIAFFTFEPKHELAPVRVTHVAPPRPKPVEPPPVQASSETPPPPVPAPSVESVAKPPEELPKADERKPEVERKPIHKRVRSSTASAAKPTSRPASVDSAASHPAPASDLAAVTNAAIAPPVATTPTAAPKPTTGPTALVTLAVSPWGEVLVDGKATGVSPPMNELELAPGVHRIEIRNGDFKPYQETLELGPNQTIRIKHKFYNR